MSMFKTSEPMEVIHLQKLANQSMLNGALVIKIVSNLSVKARKNSAIS